MSLLTDIYHLIYDNCKSELDAHNAANKIVEKLKSLKSEPCHRCSDFELMLDVNFCPFCGFEFIRK